MIDCLSVCLSQCDVDNCDKADCLLLLNETVCFKCGIALLFHTGYITTVLDDARVYSNHAAKKEVDVEDVQLAIQSRLDHSYTTPPPRDVRTQWAGYLNAVYFRQGLANMCYC